MEITEKFIVPLLHDTVVIVYFNISYYFIPYINSNPNLLWALKIKQDFDVSNLNKSQMIWL